MRKLILKLSLRALIGKIIPAIFGSIDMFEASNLFLYPQKT